jgi:methyl-accepting chemotaxis protein
MLLWRNRSINQRIIAIVAVLLGVVIFVTGFATLRLDQIGDEMAQVTEQDLPITHDLRKATEHQLLQALALERALRVVGAGTKADGYQARFAHSIEQFHQYSQLVEDELRHAHKLLDNALARDPGSAVASEFALIREELEAIEKDHKAYEAEADALIRKVENGANPATLAEQVQGIESKQQELDSAIAGLFDDMSAFTSDSIRRALAHERSAVRILLITTAGALTLGLFAGFTIGRGISNPIRHLTNATGRLADGDLTVDIPATRYNDEVARMTEALATFRRKLQRQKEMEEHELQEQHARERRQDARNQVIEIFGASIGGVMESVNTACKDMTSRAHALLGAAQQTEDVAGQVASESDDTSVNAQELRAAVEEMVNSVQEINRQVAQSDETAHAAQAKAESSSQRVAKLRDAAESISSAVTLIQDISEKTNLLALNATIEAARAGDAGKGFAVVANEVKQLANQTAKATEDISAQIHEIQQSTRETSEAMAEINTSIGHVREYTSGIASAINEQESTTREMAQSITRVADSASGIAQQMRDLQVRTGDANTNASEVQDSAKDLSEDADVLSREVETFLTSVQGNDEQAERLAARTITLGAKVSSGSETLSGKTLQIAPSYVRLNVQVPGSIGEKVEVDLDMFDRTITARIARKDAQGTTLQLPMSPEHIDSMDRELRRLDLAAA